jgi:hypothetical protein
MSVMSLHTINCHFVAHQAIGINVICQQFRQFVVNNYHVKLNDLYRYFRYSRKNILIMTIL